MFLISTIGIIGNIVGGIAMTIFLVSALIKNKNNLLSAQSIAHVLLAISEAMAKTFSSIVQECISIIRNVLVILKKDVLPVKIILITIGVGFGIFANIYWDHNSWYGYLPIIANLEYGIVILTNNVSEKTLKLSLLISNLLWAIFFLISKNYLPGAFNCASCLTAAYSFITTKKKVVDTIKKEEQVE